MSAFRQDVRYALRLLWRSPGFAAIAIVTLALGIGANTAMFAVVNAVLLKPLPFKDPNRLMLVHLLMPNREVPGAFRENAWSYPKFTTFVTGQQVFEDAALFGPRDIDLTGDGEPERTRAEIVTDRYPGVLGIEPILGRTFSYDEAHHQGADPAVLIGHGLWKRRFGGDPDVLGRRIYLNANSFSVVGVLPEGFRGLGGDAQVWVPLAALEASRLQQAQSHAYYLVARRKPNVSEPAAIAAVRLLGIGSPPHIQTREQLLKVLPLHRSTPLAPIPTSAALLSSCSAPSDSCS